MQDLTSQLASFFSLQPAQVQVVASRPGSVIADVIVGPVLPFTSLPSSQAAHILAVLQATDGIGNTNSNGNGNSNSSAEPLTLPGFNTISVLSLTPPAATQPDGKGMPFTHTSLQGLLLLLLVMDSLPSEMRAANFIRMIQSSSLTSPFHMTTLWLLLRSYPQSL